MATDLTQEAQDGQKPFTSPNPHMFSSPAWLGWQAGAAMRGHFKIVKAAQSFGYSVRGTTESGIYLVRFNSKKLEDHPEIEKRK